VSVILILLIILPKQKTSPMIFGDVHKKHSKITFFLIQSKFYPSVLNIAHARVAPPILPACGFD